LINLPPAGRTPGEVLLGALALGASRVAERVPLKERATLLAPPSRGDASRAVEDVGAGGLELLLLVALLGQSEPRADLPGLDVESPPELDELLAERGELLDDLAGHVALPASLGRLGRGGRLLVGDLRQRPIGLLSLAADDLERHGRVAVLPAEALGGAPDDLWRRSVGGSPPLD